MAETSEIVREWVCTEKNVYISFKASFSWIFKHEIFLCMFVGVITNFVNSILFFYSVPCRPFFFVTCCETLTVDYKLPGLIVSTAKSLFQLAENGRRENLLPYPPPAETHGVQLRWGHLLSCKPSCIFMWNQSFSIFFLWYYFFDSPHREPLFKSFGNKRWKKSKVK